MAIGPLSSRDYKVPNQTDFHENYKNPPDKVYLVLGEK
jgi:hypothetical protein